MQKRWGKVVAKCQRFGKGAPVTGDTAFREKRPLVIPRWGRFWYSCAFSGAVWRWRQRRRRMVTERSTLAPIMRNAAGRAIMAIQLNPGHGDPPAHLLINTTMSAIKASTANAIAV